MGKNSYWCPEIYILGTLLFIIFINDVFLFLQKYDLAHFTNDNTIYSLDKLDSPIIYS